MKEILLNISIVGVMLSLLKMLLPEDKFKSQLNFLIGCFMISSVLFFITSGSYTLEGFESLIDSEKTYHDFSGELSEIEKKEIAKNLSERLKEKFLLEKINIEEIYVTINISGHDSIFINEIELVLLDGVINDDGTRERITSLIESEVGGDIKIRFIEK